MPARIKALNKNRNQKMTPIATSLYWSMMQCCHALLTKVILFLIKLISFLSIFLTTYNLSVIDLGQY